MLNAFTVDVEDWYHTQDLNLPRQQWAGLEDRVEYSTGILLDLLAKHQVKATFFILGCIAAQHPGLVREIAGAGHEVGSHGYWHQMVYKLTPEVFRRDILISRQRLEDITGLAVKLYRAPSWSITRSSLWALQVLEEECFTVDSSIQSFRTPLYGISGVPVVPFHPVIAGKRLRLVEFPPSVLQFGKCRIPFAGGLYLRLLPLGMIASALARVNTGNNGMVYVHPWEVDPAQPRLPVQLLYRITHYANLATTGRKVERLLARFRFVPLGQLVQSGCYPAYPIDNSNEGETDATLSC